MSFSFFATVGQRRFGAQSLNSFRASGSGAVATEVARVSFCVVVTVGEHGANGQPTRANGAVTTE